ncbi:MAG TPA: hypothetical protein VHA10_15720 [Hypericibacter adhaerens]|jgi:hypothetical protein|uniref:Lipoprotein n=1 Tax=Hypericibacter adhaerens TaxID=2602016 RepID=A0A5J6N0I2_9PROT|nr:hypothetical protein [Hypericibacter adhaerens]QEX23171.1 hypothetical protein FRZ61_31060 [Hypericibacter adhaerens]HWA44665.1 hypothetical protein [Hypericibacter adhaerens]
MRAARFVALALGLALLSGLGGCTMSGENASDRWDSDLAPAVVTSADIALGREPILWVVHQPFPYGWTFYGASDSLGDRPVALSKEEALKLDPTLQSLTDLPVGFQAHRNSPAEPWQVSEGHGPE